MATRDYSSKAQTYYTPQSMFQPLLDFQNINEFDIDIASDNMNIPAKKYRTLNGEYTKDNFVFRYSEKTGLSGDFGEGIHFCNPPFRDCRKFIEIINKEIRKNYKTSVWCILPSDRFETKYYQELILKNPYCFWVALPKAGFLIPDNPLDKPIPSVKVMYCYFGLNAEQVAKSFKEFNSEMAVVYNSLT